MASNAEETVDTDVDVDVEAREDEGADSCELDRLVEVPEGIVVVLLWTTLPRKLGLEEILVMVDSAAVLVVNDVPNVVLDVEGTLAIPMLDDAARRDVVFDGKN